MCLDSVTRVNKRPSRREGIGYKVVLRKGGGWYGGPFFQGGSIRKGVWTQDTYGHVIHIHSDDQGRSTYPTGFHIFVNKKDADHFRDYMGSRTRVVKVAYRGLVARGMQRIPNPKELGMYRSVPCVVVREAKVLKEYPVRRRRRRT